MAALPYFKLGVDGFEVGGYHSEQARSGITVVFPPDKNTAGVAQFGGSPGTRETDILRPLHRKAVSVDAVALCGRSVFGFRAVEGVVECLRSVGRGYRLGSVVVPIVPAAVIFDFHGDRSDRFLPDEGWGRRAWESRSAKVAVGRAWAGRGASVAKILGKRRSTPSGQGYSLWERGGVRLGVLTVVNALGDVYDETGRLVAGPKPLHGERAVSGLQHALERGLSGVQGVHNTTIGVVVTNIRGDACDMCELARAANLGYSSVIKPFNTAFDGDTVFAVSSNEVEFDLEVAKMVSREQAALSVLSVFRKPPTWSRR